MLTRHIRRTKRQAKRLYNTLKTLQPSYNRSREAHVREKALSALTDFMRSHAQPTTIDNAKPILIDGMWDNPNYWTRLSLLMSALGLWRHNHYGLLGKFNQQRVRKTFSQFNITHIIDFQKITRQHKHAHHKAKELLDSTRDPVDILDWQLPYDLPAKVFYDAILKKQRRGVIDITDPLLVDDIAQGLMYLEAAADIFNQRDFGLVILSHCHNFDFSALAWIAAQKNIPICVLYGDYGTSRFIRIHKPMDIFAYPSRPSIEEIEKLNPNARQNLIKAGDHYLTKRFKGQSGDLGTSMAYTQNHKAIDKHLLCQHFNWDPQKPIIGVYSPNWYDYPHSFGIQDYRDYMDWIDDNLNVAKTHDHANWLFRAHPCDSWYGGLNGTTLAQLVNNANSDNIRLCNNDWDAVSLIRSIDGAVTCCGTIGLEATYLNTPVLTASDSWYRSGSFVTYAKNRTEYTDRLKKLDWLNIKKNDIETVKLYAGYYWAMPAWHQSYIYRDDSEQEKIYNTLPDFLIQHESALKTEINMINNWFKSNHLYYHIYKMSFSDQYQSISESY